MEKKYIGILIIIDVLILFFLGYVLFRFSNVTGENNIVRIIFASLVGLGIILFIGDSLSTIILKNKYKKVIINLENPYKQSIRMVASMLIAFCFTSIISKNFYVILMAFLGIFLGLFSLIRGVYFPTGLTEVGILAFGEIIKWENVRKCAIYRSEKNLIFSITKMNGLKEIKFEFLDSDIDNIKIFFDYRNIHLHVQ